MKLSQITLDEAKDAYEWAIGHHSYNDNDRFVLFLQTLGFTIDDLKEDMEDKEPLIITKTQLYEAHDGHPMDVPEGFTNTVWKYLKEIVKEAADGSQSNSSNP